jgi:hypothetical protein
MPRTPTMIRLRYTTKAGEIRIYQYPTRPRPDAMARCLRSLKRRPLKRLGKARWTAGQRGPTFNDVTITKLIARGIAVRAGDLIQLSAGRRGASGVAPAAPGAPQPA